MGNMPKIKFITLEKLLEMRVNNQDFKLVEVLPEENFAEGHIPGAINLPLDKLRVLAKGRLDKAGTILVYCGSYHCQMSTKATKLLLSIGYGKVLDFKAGKEGWVKAGLELEK